ncbi:hypothetical protein [Devosia sp. 2618]|uniref:hypothetical protein n=1 Tax=Devosia sp. 2618 TaxID=3156454 RepID=UPI0033955D36
MRQSVLVGVKANERRIERKAQVEMMIDVSPELRAWLTRKGLSAGSAGTDEGAGMKRLASDSEALGQQVTKSPREEEDSGLPNVPSPRRQTRPVLRVVNGKGGRTHGARVAPLGVRPSLTLVIGGKV